MILINMGKMVMMVMRFEKIFFSLSSFNDFDRDYRHRQQWFYNMLVLVSSSNLYYHSWPLFLALGSLKRDNIKQQSKVKLILPSLTSFFSCALRRQLTINRTPQKNSKSLQILVDRLKPVKTNQVDTLDFDDQEDCIGTLSLEQKKGNIKAQYGL